MMLATTGTKIASITQQISEGFSLMAQVVTIVFLKKKLQQFQSVRCRPSTCWKFSNEGEEIFLQREVHGSK
jgi:hypothetical protein